MSLYLCTYYVLYVAAICFSATVSGIEENVRQSQIRVFNLSLAKFIILQCLSL